MIELVLLCFLEVSSGDVPLSLELSLYDAQRFYLSLGPRTCLPSPLVPNINNDFFNPSEILFGFMKGILKISFWGRFHHPEITKHMISLQKIEANDVFLCSTNAPRPWIPRL